MHMIEEIKRNKFKATMYGEAPNMSNVEKTISFLNRYFVYKKIREVNIDKLQIDLVDYDENKIYREQMETKEAVAVAKEVLSRSKPKIRKLSKKLLLVNATEAMEDENTKELKDIENVVQKNEEKVKKTRKKTEKKTEKTKKKKILIIEDSDDD